MDAWKIILTNTIRYKRSISPGPCWWFYFTPSFVLLIRVSDSWFAIYMNVDISLIFYCSLHSPLYTPELCQSSSGNGWIVWCPHGTVLVLTECLHDPFMAFSPILAPINLFDTCNKTTTTRKKNHTNLWVNPVFHVDPQEFLPIQRIAYEAWQWVVTTTKGLSLNTFRKNTNPTWWMMKM